MWPIIFDFPRGSAGDLFQWMVEHSSVSEFTLFVLLCWSIWNTRNLLVFLGVVLSCSDVLTKAKRCGDLYCLSSNLVRVTTGAKQNLSHWDPPPFGVIKVNVDAAVYPLTDHFRVGVVGRDTSGPLFCAE